MKVAKETFLVLCDSLQLAKELDRDFLFTAFSFCLEGAESMKEEQVPSALKSEPNPAQLLLYLASEHAFYLATHGDVKQEEIIKKEDYLSFLASVSLDKYFTNEKLSYRQGTLASRYSPLVSTLNLYLNFILGMLSRYNKNEPERTLIVDILSKGFTVAKCVESLLEGGYEAEAFSTWRTLHENEAILTCLIQNGPEVIKAYLRHIQYGIAFRVGLGSKEATDAIFEEIKGKMKGLGLKSKDMKRFIEYGWLSAIPSFVEGGEAKFNFRDGVERVAGLSAYSKVYEMSSEVTHSSPVLIYSKKNYFFYMALLNLYESFFRLEKIFSTLYTASISEQEKAAYLRMRQLYYPELLCAYDFAKKVFEQLNKKN